jgi:hypothetical protein
MAILRSSPRRARRPRRGPYDESRIRTARTSPASWPVSSPATQPPPGATAEPSAQSYLAGERSGLCGAGENPNSPSNERASPRLPPHRPGYWGNFPKARGGLPSAGPAAANLGSRNGHITGKVTPYTQNVAWQWRFPPINGYWQCTLMGRAGPRARAHVYVPGASRFHCHRRSTAACVGKNTGSRFAALRPTQR